MKFSSCANEIYLLRVPKDSINIKHLSQHNKQINCILVYDSSAKYPEGFLYGNTRHLGNFDECYNLQVNMLDEDVDEITGRYCLVDIEYRRKNISLVTKTPIPEFDAHDSFWEAVEVLLSYFKLKKFMI